MVIMDIMDTIIIITTTIVTINEAYKETYSENTLENQDTILENDKYDAYDNDYYYDFSYSSRIRRFHRPMMLNYGFYSGILHRLLLV